MGKFVRIFIAIVVILSFMIWSRSDPAAAANPGNTSEQSLQSQGDSSLSAKKDDCDKKENKDKDKCQCSDKDKGKKPCGTVKPPKDKDICKHGDFSVDGVAVLNVKGLENRRRKDDDDCFHASKDSSEDVKIPNAGGALSDKIILSSMGEGSAVDICFAALPGKNVKIYYAGTDSWKPLGTQVKNGVACASVPGSGSFVLAGA